MSYKELRTRCLRALDLHPDSKETVDDCYLLARKMRPEMREAYTSVLAALFNEFIERNYRPLSKESHP